MTKATVLFKTGCTSPKPRLERRMTSALSYVVIGVALVVLMIREGLSGLPFLPIFTLLKIPAVVVAVVFGLPTIFLNWNVLRVTQKRYFVTCLLLIVGGFASLILNPQTARLEYWLLVVELAALSAGIAVFVQDVKEGYWLLTGILLIGLINCVWGLINNVSFVSTIDLASNVEAERFAGLRFDPNYFSMMIMVPLGYTLSNVASSNSTARKRLLSGVLSALFVLCILWSRSRAGGLGIVIVMCLVVALYGIRGLWRSLFVICIGTLLLTLVLGWSSYSNIMSGFVSRALFSQDEGIISRVEIWEAAGSHIWESPIWGTGPGAIEVMIRLGVYNGLGGYIKPHNGWIVVAIERGIIGAGLQIYLVLLGFRSAVHLRKVKDARYVDLANALILAGVGQLVLTMSLGGLPLGLFLTSALAVAVDTE